MQPSYDSVSCTLEPDPDFYGGDFDYFGVDCNSNIAYFDTATKIWNCPWEVNSNSNWLTTDGYKIVVDTSLAPASSTEYEVTTIWYLWCTCSDSTYTQYSDTSDYFYFQI